MSPPSAIAPPSRDAARRSSAARRRAAKRRRRSLFVVVLVGVIVIVVAFVLIAPLARRAVNEFGLPLHYQGVIKQEAAKKKLDPALIAAVIYTETKFDPRTSSAGALGLMQILPETAEFLAHRSGATSFTTSDLARPEVNIAYGSYYLRYLMDEYGNNTVLALAAYNGGEANVDQWVAAAHARGERFTTADIPFPETRAYVERVLKARQDYRQKYASELGYS